MSAPVPRADVNEPAPPAADTIVALSTAPGEAALAVVRLSGPEAIAVSDRIFEGRTALSRVGSHLVQLGRVKGPDGSPVDEVLATVMRAPRSYTGEDLVELSGHGGRLASRLVIEAAIAAGARPAQPGEFTRRAFQNGRIDLIQAEAVAELIQARGERALRNALAQLGGRLSSRVETARRRIVDLMIPIEAHIDFGDDVPEPPGLDEILPAVRRARDDLAELLAGRERGRLISEGAAVVLTGKPNVGKSSLLNALAGEDRALVHPVPGTTRDIIDVTLSIGGVPVRLIDTAGLRDTSDPVEIAGAERARRAVDTADLVLLVVDASTPPDQDDRAAAAMVAGRPAIVVRNKADLGDDPAGAAWCRTVAGAARAVSALGGSGVAELRAELGKLIEEEAGGEERLTMTRARHYDALRRAAAALERAGAAIEAGAFADMVAAELREAAGCLGELTGQTVGPDILDGIFSAFCVGK